MAQALDEVKQRVESHKSLGAEMAGKVARKGAGQDKQLAEEIVSGKRIKKKKEKAKYELRKTIISAAGISALLIGIIFALIYALQGPSAETMLAAANKRIEKFDAELNTASPNYQKVFEYSDDAIKDLNKLRSKYPDSTEAAQAKERLEYLEAGHYYRMGKEILGTEPAKKWGSAFDRAFEKLYELKTPGARPFILRARKELQEYHAPALLAEGKLYSDPNKEPDWPKGIAKLQMLKVNYPDSPQTAEGVDLLNRLLIHQAALESLRKKNILNNEEWKRTANKFESQAVYALNDELNAKPEAAIAKWRLIKEEGYKVLDDKSKSVDRLEYRPWIHLADAKLESYAKLGGK